MDKFLNYLYGQIQRARNKHLTQLEAEALLSEVLNKYKELHPEISVDVPLEAWKGKSGMQVIRFPKIFQVIEYRKQDKDSKPIKVVTPIKIEELNIVLRILSELPLNKKTSIRKIAERYCYEKNLLQFFSRSGFEYEKMFGTRRIYVSDKKEQTGFYYCIRIAEWLEYINYNRRGYVTRIKEKIEMQTVLK